jgi:hypothetical protein
MADVVREIVVQAQRALRFAVEQLAPRDLGACTLVAGADVVGVRNAR